jgi:hypothetical protein
MMGRTRVKIFELNDQELTFDFGTYALLMYYAKQINPIKGKKLINATISEWSYRIENEIPLGNITSDNHEAHFVISEINEVISFIDFELVNSLNSESKNLITKYGGSSNFVNLYETNLDYLKVLAFSDCEFFDGDPSQLILFLNELKQFFQYALSQNQAFRVYVN